jgi:hypothetical protein
LETEAGIKKFIDETRWRRLKSRYKIETVEIEKHQEGQAAAFESVEELIRRRHTHYRQRFNQRRKILIEPLADSPLLEEFTPLDTCSSTWEDHDRKDIQLKRNRTEDPSRFEDHQSGHSSDSGTGTEEVGRKRIVRGDADSVGEIERGGPLGGVSDLHHYPASQRDAQNVPSGQEEVDQESVELDH